MSRHFVKYPKNVRLRIKFKPNDTKKNKDTTKAKIKIRRLSNLEVFEFLVKHTIKDKTELYTLAQEIKRRETKT